MTQLDLPQISVARYLDLLKRRRWQVVPVSLLGLLIGGLVAFFIPRFYVADTLLVLEPTLGERSEEAFRKIVDGARVTIPLSIGPTIRELGWREAQATDAYELQQNERGIAERLSVVDLTLGAKLRTYAQLRVTYLDQDGERAAVFLNELVANWIELRLREMRAEAQARKTAASERYSRERQTFERLRDEMTLLEKTYGIAPAVDLVEQRTSARLREAELKARAEALQKKEEEAARADRELAARKAELATLDRRVVPEAKALQEKALTVPLAAQLLIQLQHAERARDNYNPKHPGRAHWEREVARLTAEIATLLGGDAVDEDGMVPNPKVAALQATIEALEKARDDARTEIELGRRRLAEDEEARRRLVDALDTYERLGVELAETEERRKAAHAGMQDADREIVDLGDQRRIKQERKASTPPRPTEPNIVLVALIGCVLGLGAAVGLILLLDVLQGTFKTAEDVERALPVPVLGGMSHLETEDERRRVAAGRRRAVVTAATLVGLVVVVVTIYYVDPLRLPPFARDLLSMVLGG
jgi:capsular polysaccharide biosynthesis protein